MKDINENFPATAVIFADNPLYIKSIREFLESYSSTVYVNPAEFKSTDYLIIYGDYGFVKTISSRINTGTYNTIVIYRENESGILPIAALKDVKSVIVDSEELSKNIIRSIFSFWFTSKNHTLDLRENISKRPNEQINIINPQIAVDNKTTDRPNVILPRLKTETGNKERKTEETADRERINKTILEVYGDTNKQKLQKTKRNRKMKIKSYISFFAAIILVLFFWYFTAIGISAYAFTVATGKLENGKTGTAFTYTYIGKNFCNQAGFILFLAKWPLYFTGKTGIIRGQEQILSFLNDTSDIINQGISLFKQTGKLSSTVLSEFYGSDGGTESIPGVIDGFGTELPSLHNKTGMASAELSMLVRNGTFPFNTGWVSGRSRIAISKLENIREEISYLENLLHVYSGMAGFSGNKTYLVIFQNSMELRPTGGFIGSYAEITFSEGRIENMNIQDVYEADGQLKGHVDPPQPLKEIMGSEHWYLRDSNWNPDFTASGRTAAWFYQKETGRNIDGVIAVSTPLLIDILKITGPVELKDFKDSITAENFFGKSLYYTQNNFFPGSTQKRDFLGTLVQEILNNMSHNRNISPWKLMNAMKTSLNGGEIMFYFQDPVLENLVTQYGWAGGFDSNRICDQASETRSCYADFIRIVEANLSVSKVNYFVNRSVNSGIKINQNGQLSTTITVTFDNSATGVPSENAANYRNYMRFFLPDDAAVSGVTVDGKPVFFRLPGSAGLQDLPYAEYTGDGVSAGQESVGVAFDVPTQKRVLVSINYSRTKILNPGTNGIIYRIVQTKQPGVRDTQITTSINYPSGWQATPVSADSDQPFLANGTMLEYNTTLSQDSIKTVIFHIKE